MNTTKTVKLQLEAINIASLKSVVAIYQNKIESRTGFEMKPSQITNNFGLPLSIASFEKRVIGYAFAVIDKEGKAEINSYWEKEFYSIEAEQNLKSHAQNTFYSTFKDPETRTLKMQKATERLFNWLNVCN
ncbi:hypothetical protein ACHRVZ_01820 [Flavobacterium sp. FlaQc-57]|uniref:hypothetical protein n=1 Tax=Flavobacterium sp. FlaQc-57 TaxID=3374186 RepID=UPI0037570A53